MPVSTQPAIEMLFYRRLALALLSFLCLTPATFGYRKVPTVYDIFALVYRLCITEPDQRLIGLECVDYHIGADVSQILDKCMSQYLISKKEPKINETTEPVSGDVRGVQLLCDKLTLIREWTAKHSRPPNQLTTVIGIEALGRMTCVMTSVQRPLPTWTAAFSKCFPKQDAILPNLKFSGKSLSSSSSNL